LPSIPRFRVEPVGVVTRRRQLAVYAMVVIVTLVALLAPFVASGVDVIRLFTAYLRLLSLPTSAYDIARYTTAMMLTGLAGVVAFRSRVWNIGLEGYMIIGAVATLAAAHLLVPSSLVEATVAFAAAAAYGSIVAFFYLLGVNEVVSSMMLYYISVQILLFIVYRIWPSGYGGFPKSLLPGPRQPLVAGVPVMLPFAILLSILVWLAYRYTLPGLVARLVKEARIETGCVEEIVSGLILERLEPLVAAAMVTRDVLERSVVAYPLSPTALAPAKSGEALGDYGAGLAAVLARHASEASVIASRLARTSIRVDPVYFNGYAGIRVEVEGIELKDPYDAPIASLALSLAASILERRSIILVVDGPLERLDEGVLQRELERVNAIVLHLKF